MAAGNSTRYGKTNKLLEKIDDISLIDTTIKNLNFDSFTKIIMVVSSDEIIKIAKKNNIEYIVNDNPKAGIGRTIRLGLNKIDNNLSGYMFLVCDQPMLKKQSILNLIDFWKENSSSICCLAHNNKRGNPVIFPNSTLNELKNLNDDESGKKVILNNIDLLKEYHIQNELELFDIDTLNDLAKLKKALCK